MNQNHEKRNDKLNAVVNKRTFFVLAISVGFIFLISQVSVIKTVIEEIIDMLFPVVLGVSLAYVVHPFTTLLERAFYKWFKFKKEKLRRRFAHGMSVVMSLVALLLVITLLIFLILPEFLNNLNKLIDSAPQFIADTTSWIEGMKNSDNDLVKNLSQYLDTMTSSLLDWLSGEFGGAFSGLLESLISFVTFLFDFIVAIVIFVYALLEKHKFIGQSKKIIFALFSPKFANDILDIARYSNEVFGKFVTGKIITSTIVGILTFAFMSILGIPYAFLSAGIIAITNVIPFFGPFIGGIPTCFIVMINDFRQGVIYALFLLVLQQIEGNVIEPMIMEDQTGVSKFWITFSLLLCGGVFGVAGMIFAVPLFAVIFYIVHLYTDRALEKNGLPVPSESYVRAGAIDPETNEIMPIPERMPNKKFKEAFREWRERVKHKNDDDETTENK